MRTWLAYSVAVCLTLYFEISVRPEGIFERAAPPHSRIAYPRLMLALEAARGQPLRSFQPKTTVLVFVRQVLIPQTGVGGFANACIILLHYHAVALGSVRVALSCLWPWEESELVCLCMHAACPPHA